MNLTKDYFEHNPKFRRDIKTEELLNKNIDDDYYKYVIFETLDRRIVVTNQANLSDVAWNFHVDNEVFESIASFDVETEAQANTILGVYGLMI